MATPEAKVISALCKNKDIHAVLGEDAEMFGPFGDIVEFMRDYYARFKAVPAVELIEQKFGDIELPETTAPTKFYVEELRDSYMKGRLRRILTKASESVDGSSGSETWAKLSEAVAKLGKFTGGARDLNLTDLEKAEEHFRKLREASESNNGTPGISTGFKSIDSVYTTGMAPGHSIVVMGYTGRAKSMWTALLAVKAWEQGYKPMVISLEMSPEEYMERVYAMMSSGLFKISDLSRGDISLDNLHTWGKKKFSNSNDFIVVSNEGISEVTPNIIQAKIDVHRPDIVILDYLQLMKDNAKTQAMTPRMLNLSREVKMLAVSNAIPVVSITAVTDEDGDKRDTPPVLSQVSWSSGIEYDANLAIAVHRHDDSNLVELVARKNRHGELFDFYFSVSFNEGVWEEKFVL